MECNFSALDTYAESAVFREERPLSLTLDINNTERAQVLQPTYNCHHTSHLSETEAVAKLNIINLLRVYLLRSFEDNFITKT